MHLKGFCNVAWAASIVRWSAEHLTDLVTYLAFTYIKSCNFGAACAHYFGLTKLIDLD